MVALTGIRAPVFKSQASSAGGSTQAVEAEPFAEEARFFVESRLLGRDVTVKFDGVTGASGSGGSGAVLATVLHPNGNISEFLVQNGLARCSDWSLSLQPKKTVETIRN